MPPSHAAAEEPLPDAIYERVAADIVSGALPAGARLPAERELVTRFATSRVTLREALRRLVGGGMIAVRRGSGAVVRHLRDWSFEVLPLHLRYARYGEDAPGAVTILADLLALRRALVLHAVERAAGRLQPGALGRAREALRTAWSARGDAKAFTEGNLEMMRELLLAARMLPALWMLNDLGRAYVRVASPIAAALPVPADYLSVHEAMFAALERGDARKAIAHIDGYMRRQEAALDLGDGKSR